MPIRKPQRPSVSTDAAIRFQDWPLKKNNSLPSERQRGSWPPSIEKRQRNCTDQYVRKLERASALSAQTQDRDVCVQLANAGRLLESQSAETEKDAMRQVLFMFFQ